jgi:hypothetical protein
MTNLQIVISLVIAGIILAMVLFPKGENSK